jgi:glutamyl-Q tRNA(Asp) synthetase
MSISYKGRFAPTPSGPAHLGTMFAALGSFLQARARRGEWHVRIDDIDPPRVVPGAADSILHTLERYGLHWDGEVVYQNHRTDTYQDAIQQLVAQHIAYECTCSRKEIEKVATRGMNGMIYPGTCRQGCDENSPQKSIRLRTEDVVVTVNDAIQPKLSINVENDIGDFVIRRADNLIAYHLATVVDDALDEFTQIVRGKDQFSLTPQHIYLQQRLGVKSPEYAHLPLLTDQQGEKLSKSSRAAAIDTMPMNTAWTILLGCFDMYPEPALLDEPPQTILDWAVDQWDLLRIKASDKIIQ